MDDGEAMQLSVKDFSPRQAYLRLGFVCRKRWEKTSMICFLKKLEVGVSSDGKFPLGGFEVAQETGPMKELPSQKVLSCWQPCHFFIHVQSSPPEKSWA